MPLADAIRWLEPVSDDAPCGEDLEAAGKLWQIEQDALGKPERVMGGSTIPAEEPNWKTLAKDAEALLAGSRDLRVVLIWTAAQLRLAGLEGLETGLRVVRGLLEQHWDSLYPPLDPDDGDPIFRSNALAVLSAEPGASGDGLRFRTALRDVPIAWLKGAGKLTLRDVEVAEGSAAPPKEAANVPDMNLVRAFFTGMRSEDPAGGEALLGQIRAIRDHLQAIDSLLIEKAPGRNPDLSGLQTLVKRIEKLLAEAFDAAGSTDAPDDGGRATAPGGGPPPAGTSGARMQVSGEVATRNDVVALLDSICRYYARCEPSSPVPLLLQRARELVELDYVEIVRRLTPDALDRLAVIFGDRATGQQDSTSGG